jgi:AcrR family transcriptional regulator
MQSAMARPSVKEERRDEILTAFENCVVRKGLANTTLTDVAEEAGQPRSLVRYFLGNRDAMIGHLIERLLERGHHILATFGATTEPASVENLTAMVMEKTFADPKVNAVIMELWHISVHDASLRPRVAGMYEALVREVARQLLALAPAADRPVLAGGVAGSDCAAADASSDAAVRAYDAAYAAVALSFGTSFFKGLGLYPSAAARVRHSVLSVMRGGA